MPAIKTLRLKNFRSVGNNTQNITLGDRVTVFIGPNNSGKSNILRALSLILKTSFHQPNSTEAHLFDFHKITKEEEMGDPRDLSYEGNCEITYSFSDEDIDKTVTHLIESIYSYLRYGREKEKIGKSRLSKVVAEYLTDTFTAVAKLNRKNGKIALSRTSTVPSWSLTDKEKQKRIDEYMVNLDELLGYSDNRSRVFEEIINFAYPNLGIIPRGPIPLEPQKLIPFEKIRNSTPTPETLRNFLAMMKDDEFNHRTEDMPFTRIVRIIRRGFPQIENIDAGIDPETGHVRVMIIRGGRALELGYQGDGLKELLMFLVFLTYFQGDVVIVDEPERYMHPEIETSFISYFLQFGKSQLVLATHSESIVNSVPIESIDSNQVLVYGVSQESDGSTTITQESESSIISILEKIGVPTTRYVKHMAALSRTLIFVEGVTDKSAIYKILVKHDRTKDLDRFIPFFIPMEGAANFSKLSTDVIDSIAKGDDELDSPSVPFLILRDFDEGVQESNANQLVLSVREIENLVISEVSIIALAEEFLVKLGLELQESWKNEFEKNLAEGIRKYSFKWTFLVLRRLVDSKFRLLRKHGSIGSSWKISKYEALDILAKYKQHTIETISRTEDVLTEKKLDEIREDLLKDCFKDKGVINYSVVVTKIPGKDFIRYIMKEALIETAQTLVQNSKMTEKTSEDRIRGLAGSMSSFDGFLKNMSEFPSDIERLFQRLETLKVQKE